MKKINILFSQSLNETNLDSQTSTLINYAEKHKLNNYWIYENLIETGNDNKLDNIIENVKKSRIDTIYITDASVLCSEQYSTKQIYSILKDFNTNLIIIS